MLIVFDLDFTLWNCGGTWCDHTSPPYTKQNGILFDSEGRMITLYPDVYAILEHLQNQKIQLGVASRTSAPQWADLLMQQLDIKRFITHFEIYPGSKVPHFESLRQKTKIAYEDMVFFDDEFRNIEEVGQLGVKTVLVENGFHTELIEPFLN